MNVPTHRMAVLALMAVAWTAVSCGGSSGTGPPDVEPRPTSITISPSIASMDVVGETVQFTATVRDQMNQPMAGVSVSWSSSDEEVATISSTGLATAVGTGTASMIASVSSSVFGWADLTVTVTPIAITTANLYPGVVGLEYSQTLEGEGVLSGSWSVSDGALPPGLSLDGETGAISGTPTTAGTYTFTIMLSGGGQTTSKDLTLFVASDDLGLTFEDDQFVLVPAGSFQMGSDNGEAGERPVHTVNITHPLYIQKTEVTQYQWQSIMGDNPSSFQSCGQVCPVETVSWNMVQDFLDALNALYPGKNFRLPTEAEWEYAARAGTTGDYAGGGNLDEMGWYSGNTAGRPRIVALKLPNDWGLYDMHGNAREWVQDFYAEFYYYQSPTDDPQGPETGMARGHRGGGADTNAARCRSASRDRASPALAWAALGFRLVRDP